MKLIECVPNFSEGRRPDVVAAIRDAIGTAALTEVRNAFDEFHERMIGEEGAAWRVWGRQLQVESGEVEGWRGKA